MPDAPSVFLTIVTLLIGYATKSVTDLVEHKRTTNREREARQDARRAQLLERRTTFQRETLLKLQEATLRLARATGAIHHQDVMAHRTTGQWQRQQFPEDLNENYRVAQVETTILTVRVRDDVIRELMDQLKQFSTQVTMSDTPENSERAMRNLAETLELSNQRIGEVLRHLDDNESGAA